MRGFQPQPVESALDRIPTAERIYFELRQRILYGSLEAGALLNEVDTAAELGVSRTPVREALRELLNDGLIKAGPRRQAIVTSPSPRLCHEVELLHSGLEKISVREAAMNHDVSSIDVLRLIMIRTRRALVSGNINVILDCDDEFHLQIAQTANLPIITDQLRRIRALVRLVKLVDARSVDDLKHSMEEHEDLIEYLEAGNADAAEKAIVQHLEKG